MSDNVETIVLTETTTTVAATLPTASAAAPSSSLTDALSRPAPSRAEQVHRAAGIVLRDLRRFYWIMMLALVGLASYHTVRISFYNPRDYYAYQGTSGPYEYLQGSEGRAEAGRPMTAFAPGQRFAWVVAFCLDSSVTVRADFRLVRLAQNGQPEQEVARKSSVVGPENRRCGPLVNSWSVPSDAVPGQYEMRRSVVIRDSAWFPLTQDFDPVRFTVMPLANPAPQGAPPFQAEPSVLRSPVPRLLPIEFLAPPLRKKNATTYPE